MNNHKVSVLASSCSFRVLNDYPRVQSGNFIIRRVNALQKYQTKLNIQIIYCCSENTFTSLIDLLNRWCKTMVLWSKLMTLFRLKTIEHWFIKGKKHVKLPKAAKLLFIKKKIPMEIYQNNFMFFEQIYSLRTFIYHGKTMVLSKNYGTMEKKTMVIWKKQ